ncbi:MAG: proline iminopeptidase-family hydrolase [Alphaproteobacteria bacterium]|nr:proline iminopeptidase-family hydrolase [Alphaproteobacteria bacterium]MBV9694209.1 proline iminopeptidase-family hydrolase [Alphaproteobacteria bacterium]
MLARREFLSAAASAAALGLGGAHAEVKTGGVRMISIPGGYRVWTKRIGRSPIKVLLLHGGPGFSHDYFECFEDFLPEAGIEFYYYDQLGCGNSDRPNDDKLWTIPRYVDEVETVRQGLGLDDFILYGHSWGGMLAIEYALKYQRHLRRLVISDMTASIPDYVRHANEIRHTLSAADQATLTRYENLRKTDAAPYQAVMNRVYAEHILRLPQPWPEPVTRVFAKANFHIYNLMQGPNEFMIDGTFKNWDRWADLPRIKVPTLVMGAKFDEMDPEQIRREGKLIPGARTWISGKGSHLCMYDDQEAYFAALVPFLKGRT